MLRTLLALVLLAIAGFAIYVASLPAQFSVERSAVIAASAEAIYPQVNSFRKWNDWSPWAKRDPNAKETYSGPETGEGAKFAWDGNDEVGKGSMTIVEARRPEHIAMKLEFERPFPGTSDVTFDFVPQGPSDTKVTWKLSGDQGFMERAILLVMGMDMDVMIGKEYDTGLANLKRLVESGQSS